MVRITNIKIYENISNEEVFKIAINKYKINHMIFYLGKFRKNQLMPEKKTMFILIIL